jgi:glycosyltransferase involved in cell wall biosynthesis
LSELVVNGRFRSQKMTGAQRVAEAITSRLRVPHDVVQPARKAEGMVGHAWEQFVLPVRAKGRLIWGPCSTGPCVSNHQLVTIHGAAVFDHPEWFSSSFARMSHTLWPILAKKAHKIITVSEYSKGRLIDVLGLPGASIEVIWNGVDEHFHPAKPEEIQAAKAQFGIADRPYFATLSTLEPRKNLGLVLKAWERVRAKLPKDTILLVIGGKGRSKVFNNNGIEMDIEKVEGVKLSGYVPETVLPHLLSGAMAVMYPSLYEGFGLPVVEAMACGSPAITSTSTCLPEIAGDAAFYVDVDDADGLANVVEKLAYDEDLRKEYRERGIARAKLFSWDTSAAKMDNLVSRYL